MQIGLSLVETRCGRINVCLIVKVFYLTPLLSRCRVIAGWCLQQGLLQLL